MKVFKSLCLLLIFFITLQAGIAPAAAKRQLVIGALLSITGGWPTLGNSSAAALQIAAADVNEYLQKIGVDLQVSVIIENTKLNPDLALKKLQQLSQEGVDIVIGPQSSAEIAQIRSFAEQKGILIVSQSSTAGSLAIAGDNVFRLCPDDGLEGEAIAALMYEDGIRTVVPIWRDDAGNGGLEASTRTHFSNSGGSVLSGVKYAATTNDFSSAVSALETQVNDAISQQDGNQDAVGVYLAAFDEARSIFHAATSNSTLSSVRWYGSDGVALSQTLLNDPDAADFAKHASYPNPLPGLPTAASSLWRPIIKKIKAQTGVDPEAFALGVYDAVWILTRTAALRPGFISTGFIKDNLRRFAASYFGSTGWTVLNKAGDRKFGDFDFWAIRDVKSVPQWVRIANYDTASKTLTRFE